MSLMQRRVFEVNPHRTANDGLYFGLRILPHNGWLPGFAHEYGDEHHKLIILGQLLWDPRIVWVDLPVATGKTIFSITRRVEKQLMTCPRVRETCSLLALMDWASTLDCPQCRCGLDCARRWVSHWPNPKQW